MNGLKKQTFGQTSSYRTKLIFIQDFAKSFKTHPFLHILLTNSQTFFPLFLIVETGHKEDKKKKEIADLKNYLQHMTCPERCIKSFS